MPSGAFSLAVLFIIQLDNSTEPALEIAYALVLVLMLTGCMLLSLRLYQLRGRLRKQRQELAAALEENRELASRDALTGLINRRHMRELLELEQRRCVRGVRTMLLAQMDIDHFKSINDTYGHGVGDMALKAFAQTVRDNIRNSDVLARWGGEEFVLLLSDTDVAGAMLTLQRVRAAVEGTTMADAPPGPADDRLDRSGRAYGGRDVGSHPRPRRQGPVQRQARGPQPGDVWRACCTSRLGAPPSSGLV